MNHHNLVTNNVFENCGNGYKISCEVTFADSGEALILEKIINEGCLVESRWFPNHKCWM